MNDGTNSTGISAVPLANHPCFVNTPPRLSYAVPSPEGFPVDSLIKRLNFLLQNRSRSLSHHWKGTFTEGALAIRPRTCIIDKLGKTASLRARTKFRVGRGCRWQEATTTLHPCAPSSRRPRAVQRPNMLNLSTR